ncbi:MAG: polymer-forming cytoskeletal protein [Candidatus Hodarchaeota archaeon]
MSRKEIDELKTLIKALDIRLKNEEISQEEYNKLMEKYEAKLEEQISIVKENSFLRNVSYVAISGSGKVTDSHISISGSGRVEGWKGGSISISGSGKITDEEIKVSGSASLPADMQTNVLNVSGSLKVNGSMKTTKLSCSGSIKIEGPLEVYEKMNLSGSGKIEGDIKADDASVQSSGSLKVLGGLFCHDAELNGAYKIQGDVICQDSFNSELNAKCDISGELKVGGNVYIEQESHKGFLEVNKITAEGDVYLEGVSAEYVSGKTVKIGPDCKIDTIEETG